MPSWMFVSSPITIELMSPRITQAYQTLLRAPRVTSPTTVAVGATKTARTVTVELAPGVRIEDTARVTSRAAQIVASHPEVEDVLETVGGGDDNDIINGFAGNDLIKGEGGNDTLFAGIGNDRIEGGTGNDTIRGHEGNDLLLGGDGDDTLRGDAGDDTINGGDGNDILTVSHGQQGGHIRGSERTEPELYRRSPQRHRHHNPGRTGNQCHLQRQRHPARCRRDLYRQHPCH